MLNCIIDDEELIVYIEKSGQNIEEVELVAEDGKIETHTFTSDYYTFLVNDVSYYLDHFTLEEEGYLQFSINDEVVEMFYYSDEERNILTFNGHNFEVARKDYLIEQDVYVSSAMENGNAKIVAPMPGKVIKINVEENQEVKKGEVLLIVEAMKMENNITAPKNGKVEKVNVSAGDMVDGSTELVNLYSSDTED
jgi:3-methylcrotonyl-CoA carboxylase alpha subunit